MRWVVLSICAATSCSSDARTAQHPQSSDRIPPSIGASDGICRYSPAHYSGARSGARPIYEVECLPSLGGPPPGPRPPGREGWLRMRPWLQMQWADNRVSDCRFTNEAFCPPPPLDVPCDWADDQTSVACAPKTTPANASSSFRVERFTWRDKVGRCHRVDALECEPGCRAPEGELVACEP
jgi:hypothetical protein